MESRKNLAMCRLCLCENEYFNNVFELNDRQGYIAAEVISDLLQFQVSETDGYPHVVCSKCLLKLTDFKLFKERCQKSIVKYDNMFVSSESLAKHQPEMLEFVTVKAEPMFYSDNKDDVSEDVGNDSEWCDPDPLREDSSHVSIKSEEVIIDSCSSVVSEDPLKETEVDYGPILLKYEVLPFGRDSHTQVQHAAVDTVTNSHHLQCFGHKRTQCTSKGVIDADSYKSKISTESSSGTIERMEGQFISPEKGIYMAPLIQEKIGISVEVKKEELGGEEGRRTAAKKGLDGERKQFECYHCGSVLTTKRTLIKHMMLHGFGQTYNCDICGKAFQSKYGLTRHAFIHAGSKPYKCVECMKCFYRDSCLKNHMRTHMAPKLYKCLECSKYFSSNCSLKAHMRLHLGSKPYKCAVCLKCFSHESSLKVHMRSHTDSKPYKCSECSKHFSDNSNLKTHMRIHTGSKPFKCGTCSKGFTTSSDLKRHLLVHTRQKPHECHNCKKRFSQKGGLKIHLERHCKVGKE